MFPLVKLPNELILHVINDVHPEDLEPLALCGKAIRALAKDALSRHMMLKRKYNEIIIADKARSEPSEKDNGFGYHDQHSFVLIEEISEDKSLACYPRDISFGHNSFSCSYAANHAEEQLESYRALVSQASHICETLIRSCHSLREDEKDFWCHDLRDIKSVANALLLALLPNIQRLTITEGSFWGIEDHVWIAVEGVASLNYRRRASEKSYNGEALSKLRHLTLSFDVNDDSHNIQAFTLFATFSSIRSLEGNGIRASDPSRVTWPKYFKMGTSTLTKISFKNSGVSPVALGHLLVGIGSLEEFLYHHHAQPHAYNFHYEPQRMVRMLQIHAAGSLVKLDLTAVQTDDVETDRNTVCSGSLQMFTVLKAIRADDNLFRTPASLTDVLPKTITSIELIQHWQPERTIQLLQHVVKAKATHLPILEDLSYRHSGAENTYIGRPLRLGRSLMKALREVGITTLTVELVSKTRHR